MSMWVPGPQEGELAAVAVATFPPPPVLALPSCRPRAPGSPQSCTISSGSSSFTRDEEPEAVERWRSRTLIAETWLADAEVEA